MKFLVVTLALSAFLTFTHGSDFLSAVVNLSAAKLRDELLANLISTHENVKLHPHALAPVFNLQLAVLSTTDALQRDIRGTSALTVLKAFGGDKEILKRFALLQPQFASVERHAEAVRDNLARVAHVANGSAWGIAWDSLEATLLPVTNLYEWFERYQRSAGMVNEKTLQDYADVVHTADELSTPHLLDALHDMTCPSNATDNASLDHRKGAFDLLADALKASDGTLCSLTKSPHQLVFDFYSLLALTDAKGYAMMQFSWMLLRLYGKGNFSMEADMARADFERRILEKAGAARRVLADMPNWLWKCDPSPNDHHEGQTYLQLTEVLQGYLINEVDMNNINTCRENCAAYPVATDQNCFGNGFCAEQKRCDRGRIFNCRFVEADSTVCLSASLTRRYDWVEYKSGRLLGQRNDCQGRGQSQKRVDSWWRWMFWHCSYCLCLCDQPNIESDRFISLRALTSDIAQNRLITGVRFVKTGRVVSLQIQDGVALPRGGVNASTVDWRPLAPFRVTDTLPEHHNSSADYAMITWENRAIDLDDLNVPENHVITGVRFRKLGSHLNLEVQATPIDFVTGTLDNERSQWIGNDNTPESNTPRAKLGFTDPDISIRSSVPSMVDSKPDQYVEFQASSIEKDVGQTTVPFFDAQPVVPEPPTWLTGMGLFHKGQPGYGGFLSLKVATLNVTNYLALPSMPGAMN